MLQEYSLENLFDKLNLKYPKTDYNEARILKSLVYFSDAEGQPMPKMHKIVEWEDVKKEIIAKVKNLDIISS